MCPSEHPSPSAPSVSPKRPVSPPPKPTPTSASGTSQPEPSSTGLAFPLAEGEELSNKPSPIPPPSEALQYRAIGLVRGRYVPDVDQFTKGNMITSDGTTINTVLLGRVMSLLKKHVDLTVDHLWVVYPRTRAEDLHMQIVGIWEPETLNKTSDEACDEAVEGEAPDEELDDSETLDNASQAEAKTQGAEVAPVPSEASAAPEGPKVINLVKPARPSSKPVKKAGGRPKPKPIPYHVPEDGFSIRGEVILQSKEENYVMVQIKQQARPPKHKGKSFKLRLEGILGDRAVGHFWDIQVLRKNDQLTILSGTSMGALPPQKRKKSPGKGRRPAGGAPSPRGDRPSTPRSEHPRPRTSRPAKPRPKVQE